MLLEEKLEGRKVQSLPFLLSRNMNYHTLKNEGFCPNEVIHFTSYLKAKAFIIEKAKDKKNLIFLVRGAERFGESFLSQKNVIRFGQGESRKMYFTLQKHGKKLLDHIM